MKEGISSEDFKLKSVRIFSFIQPFKDSIIGLSVGVSALDIELGGDAMEYYYLIILILIVATGYILSIKK